MILNLNCCYSISANRRKQKDWFLWKNMHQSMSRNWENSSSMLQSPPKYLFSIEIEISATVLSGLKVVPILVNHTVPSNDQKMQINPAVQPAFLNSVYTLPVFYKSLRFVQGGQAYTAGAQLGSGVGSGSCRTLGSRSLASVLTSVCTVSPPYPESAQTLPR